jgi:hypothetical protein
MASAARVDLEVAALALERDVAVRLAVVNLGQRSAPGRVVLAHDVA